MFSGYSVCVDYGSMISHLEYSDDTIILGDMNWSNVRSIKDNLLLFELASNLKVNFHKSVLVGVNASNSWLEETTNLLNYKVGKVPFKYLGLSIGYNTRRLSFCNPMVDKIRGRLSGWRYHNMSREIVWFSLKSSYLYN